MRHAQIKLLLAALIFCIGSLASYYVSKSLPTEPCLATPCGGEWNAWDYSSLLAMICAIGLIIAAIKIRD
ncbi:MAG TPA: hypothetical protein VJU84_19180 [Pyrinomonadaceae bacterium]|nr:hypothetical protein [Pyrinomonadaceae bacterium]